MASYLKTATHLFMVPPQSQPLNKRQVANSAGGYVYPVDDWKRLDRFLILGSEGGSYYATEKKLTTDNIGALDRCLKEDGMRTVDKIVECSFTGRAPKNDPALLALAYCASAGDEETRGLALDALPRVARTGTHLFHFADYVQEFRGWGRGLRRAIGDWYKTKTPEQVADQVVKYQQRDGWTHRDLIRLAHPEFTGAYNDIARWVVKGELSGDVPERIEGHVLLQAETNPRKAAQLIRDYGLVRESVPTELLKEKVVWEALLLDMPLMATIRNLGNMSKCGLLVPLSGAAEDVVEKISNGAALVKSRIHPLQILLALRTYGAGHGLRGSGVWNPVPSVLDALDTAFYDSFGNIEPTGKNFYLGLDISGSMYGGDVAGVPGFTPAEASGAMAMATLRSERNCYSAGFTTSSRGYQWNETARMEELKLSSRQGLDTVLQHMREMSTRMGGTDCAMPMIDAAKRGMKVDVFIIYTDSETWHGGVHPSQALALYRQQTGIPAKLVVMAMVSNEFSIADPNDGGMLDVIGFDASAPAVISDFVGGEPEPEKKTEAARPPKLRVAA